MKNNNGVWKLNTFEKILMWASAVFTALVTVFSLNGDSVSITLFYLALFIMAGAALDGTVKRDYVIDNLLGKFAYGYAWVICVLASLSFFIGFFAGLMSV